MTGKKWKLFEYDIVDSTNELAKKLCSGINRKFIVTAGSQTNGKGQYGRKWLAPHGENLLASFVINENLVRSDFNIALSTAVAVCKLLENFNLTPKCKWPNDVLINNAKIAGILIEKITDFFIIGIGLNVNWPQKKSELDNKKICTSILAETNEHNNIKKILFSLADYLDFFLNYQETIIEYKQYWKKNIKCKTLFNDSWIPVNLIDITKNGSLITYSKNHGVIEVNSSALIKTYEL